MEATAADGLPQNGERRESRESITAFLYAPTAVRRCVCRRARERLKLPVRNAGLPLYGKPEIRLKKMPDKRKSPGWGWSFVPDKS